MQFLSDPKFQNFLGGKHTPRPDPLIRACFTHSILSNASVLRPDDQLLCSLHIACTIFCLTKAFFTPESLFSFPYRSLPLSLLSQRGRNFQQLLVSLQQKTAKEMHTSRSSRNTTYSYSRCVICVHVCVCVCDMWIHVSAYVHECIHLLANATKFIIIWFISPNND